MLFIFPLTNKANFSDWKWNYIRLTVGSMEHTKHGLVEISETSAMHDEFFSGRQTFDEYSTW